LDPFGRIRVVGSCLLCPWGCQWPQKLCWLLKSIAQFQPMFAQNQPCKTPQSQWNSSLSIQLWGATLVKNWKIKINCSTSDISDSLFLLPIVDLSVSLERTLFVEFETPLVCGQSMRIDWFLSRFLKRPLWLWNVLPRPVGRNPGSPWRYTFVIELTIGGSKGNLVWQAEQGQIGALWHFWFCTLSWPLSAVSRSLWHAWEH
jgi:hypothetical protein